MMVSRNYRAFSVSLCSIPGASESAGADVWAKSGPHAAKEDVCQTRRAKTELEAGSEIQELRFKM